MVSSVHCRARRAPGFTLLEVMVALAILGLALSAILSAQAGLYDANVRARNLTIATSAARCKMTEIEATLLKDGYPEVEEKHEGACCDDESPKGFGCRWTIQRVLLPDPPGMGDAGSGSAIDMNGLGALAGGLGGSSGSAGGLGALAGGLGGSSGGMGGLGALAGLASDPSAILDGGIAGVSQMLAGSMGTGGVAGMAMSMVYPVLRPLLEASIRRVDLEVYWNEGPIERKIELVQFVTNPTKGLSPMLSGADGGVTPLGGAGLGGAGSPLTSLPGIGH